MSFKKKRILCIDDDELICLMLYTLFGARHYEATTADTIITALLLAQSQAFDIYIVDRKFRSGSGLELCQQIRRFDSETPIIIYSGMAHKSDRRAAREAGATAFVAKPHIEELLERVEYLLTLIAGIQSKSKVL